MECRNRHTGVGTTFFSVAGIYIPPIEQGQRTRPPAKFPRNETPLTRNPARMRAILTHNIDYV